jgi:hypothetical protein
MMNRRHRTLVTKNVHRLQFLAPVWVATMACSAAVDSPERSRVPAAPAYSTSSTPPRRDVARAGKRNPFPANYRECVAMGGKAYENELLHGGGMSCVIGFGNRDPELFEGCVQAGGAQIVECNAPFLVDSGTGDSPPHPSSNFCAMRFFDDGRTCPGNGC